MGGGRSTDALNRGGGTDVQLVHDFRLIGDLRHGHRTGLTRLSHGCESHTPVWDGLAFNEIPSPPKLDPAIRRAKAV
ncbi:MAG: hypothetical protein NPIRA03_40450 [Nitrospirales bacterium]|nr:MAG: hypothetical protein NPIRA03_40450 [Nitrospirales bacterium]